MPQKPLILPNGAGAPPRQKQPDVSHAKTVCCEYCGHNIFTLGFVLKEINGLELGIGPGMTTVPLEVPNLFICANCGKPHYLNDNIKRHIEALLAGDGSLAKIEEEDRKQMEEIQRAQAEKEAKEAAAKEEVEAKEAQAEDPLPDVGDEDEVLEVEDDGEDNEPEVLGDTIPDEEDEPDTEPDAPEGEKESSAKVVTMTHPGK
jgi:hypothetical protein